MYKLKNKTLQKTLDRITSGKFSDALKNAERNLEGNWFLLTVSMGEGITAKFEIRDFETEEIPHYKPETWNNFPEIMPPVGVPMMLEKYDVPPTLRNHKGGKERLLWRGCAVFNGTDWRTFDGEVPGKTFTGQKLRFKAWGAQ